MDNEPKTIIEQVEEEVGDDVIKKMYDDWGIPNFLYDADWGGK